MKQLALLAQLQVSVHLQRPGHLVGDEQDGDPALEVVCNLGNLLHGDVIQAGHRLVEDEHARAARANAFE